MDSRGFNAQNALNPGICALVEGDDWLEGGCRSRNESTLAETSHSGSASVWRKLGCLATLMYVLLLRR